MKFLKSQISKGLKFILKRFCSLLSSRGFIIKDHVGVFLMKYSHSKAKNHAGKRELVGGDIRVITLKYCAHVNYSRALTIKRSSIAEIFRSSVSQTFFSPTSS